MTVKQVLSNLTVDGNIVRLPDVQLNYKKVYIPVKKKMELIGGKWKGGKIKGFVFDLDPTELIQQISNGEQRNLKKEYQFFATPKELAQILVEMAELQPSDKVLEPSAGQGAIIEAINEKDCTPDCYELMELNVIKLKQTGFYYNFLGNDFFNHDGRKYDKIIANPPFSKNQDIDHLKEMYCILNDGGRLVCITSESWVFGNQKKQIAFRQWLKDVNSYVTEVPKGSFKGSGTMVGGRIVVIDK